MKVVCTVATMSKHGGGEATSFPVTSPQVNKVQLVLYAKYVIFPGSCAQCYYNCYPHANALCNAALAIFMANAAYAYQMRCCNRSVMLLKTSW